MGVAHNWSDAKPSCAPSSLDRRIACFNGLEASYTSMLLLRSKPATTAVAAAKGQAAAKGGTQHRSKLHDRARIRAVVKEVWDVRSGSLGGLMR